MLSKNLRCTIAVVVTVLLTSVAHAALQKHTVTKSHTVTKKHTTKTHKSKLQAKKPAPVETVAEVVTPEPTVEPRTPSASTFNYQDTQVPRRSDHSARDLDCLAKNIYYEAGNEPRAGKIAVAQVTLNRVRSGKFADTICGVVYQRSQFSWVREIRRKLNVNDNRWQESVEVALAVLNGDELLASMEHALYFHNTSVRPAWGKPRIGRIGNHIFYRDRAPVINEDI